LEAVIKQLVKRGNLVSNLERARTEMSKLEARRGEERTKEEIEVGVAEVI
jgi:hypothetical protein